MSLLDKAYNNHLNFIVALDGPSASGKGHIGSLIAEEFSLTYVSSSIMYRGLAYICLQEKVAVNEEQTRPIIVAEKDDGTRAKEILEKIKGKKLSAVIRKLPEEEKEQEKIVVPKPPVIQE